MMTHANRLTSPKLVMGNLAPVLEVQTLDGSVWSLADQVPDTYTMVVFYRGEHCPICEQYLTELDQALDAFRQLGVSVIAISGDTQASAEALKAKAGIQHVPMGYGLTPDDMRRWGLYLSTGHFPTEPALFSEPALFLITSDGRLYLANIGTHPFSRINFEFLLQGLKYVISQDYPFRGTAWD